MGTRHCASHSRVADWESMRIAGMWALRIQARRNITRRRTRSLSCKQRMLACVPHWPWLRKELPNSLLTQVPEAFLFFNLAFLHCHIFIFFYACQSVAAHVVWKGFCVFSDPSGSKSLAGVCVV